MRALVLVLLEPGALYSTCPWDDAGHLPVAEIAYDRFSSGLQPKLQGALAGLKSVAILMAPSSTRLVTWMIFVALSIVTLLWLKHQTQTQSLFAAPT